MLGLSMCLQPFTIDPYLASYPAIETDFDVSTALIQFSLTGVTLGFAFGQIFAGTLSDSIGRRVPMIFAVSLYAVSAFAMLWATNIETFIALRTLMAVGASAAGVLANAVVRDLYAGKPMMKMLSRVFLVQGLSPILGPLIGACSVFSRALVRSSRFWRLFFSKKPCTPTTAKSRRSQAWASVSPQCFATASTSAS